MPGRRRYGVKVGRRYRLIQDRPRRREGWLHIRCNESPAMMHASLAGKRLSDQADPGSSIN